MSQSPKIPLVAGNWKMYKTIAEATQFVDTLAPLIAGCQARVYLAVPFTAIQATVGKVKELEAQIVVGAQNMNDASEGAFTGEIAAKMLKEVGAHFVILGHSERRKIFQETSAFINKKLKRALQEGLEPILCIGETLEERESGKTESVLEEQLKESLEGVTALEKVIIAYEPVWAIGTGVVATPEDAEKAHVFCRKVLGEIAAPEVASQMVIQYGGSVKGENAAQLMAQPNIDGLLVGGASLSPESFSEVIKGIV